MLKSRANRSQIPNQIKLILEEVSKMTVNDYSIDVNEKRARDRVFYATVFSSTSPCSSAVVDFGSPRFSTILSTCATMCLP